MAKILIGISVVFLNIVKKIRSSIQFHEDFRLVFSLVAARYFLCLQNSSKKARIVLSTKPNNKTNKWQL